MIGHLFHEACLGTHIEQRGLDYDDDVDDDDDVPDLVETFDVDDQAPKGKLEELN